MAENIAIIGASDHQAPLIEKAKELGYVTHVFAWQTGDLGEKLADRFYPISVLKRDEILAQCCKIKPAAVVSISSNTASATAAYVARQLGQPANAETVYNCTGNKHQMRQILSEAQINVPKHMLVDDAFSLEALQDFHYPLIVKPVDRSNSRGLSRVAKESELLYAVMKARELSYVGQVIVEEEIVGEEYGCDTITYSGKHQVISYSAIQSDGFRVKSVMQPGYVKGIRTSAVNALIYRTLDAIGITSGASHIKFIVSQEDHKIFVIRVTASMGSDHVGSQLIPLTTSFDYLKMVIDVAEGKKLQPAERVKHIFAKLQYLTTPEDQKELDVLRQTAPQSLHFCTNDYYITAEHPREMGGFLPLEIKLDKDYFTSFSSQQVVKLNSARTAVWYVAETEKPNRIWVPILYTPSVYKALAGIELCEYHIDGQFMPTDIAYRDGDMVILMNYYGVTGNAVCKVAEQYPKVIVDNSFAFFEKPIMRDGVFNIYSCRRFFGVPDGAYLIGQRVQEMALEQDVSYASVAHLMKALEFDSSNAGHAANNRNEQRISNGRLKMSALTEKLMRSIDYATVRKRRKENYSILSRAFFEQSLPLEINHDAVPQCFPLVAEPQLRSALNQFDIHIPLLWRRVINAQYADTVEMNYAEHVVCLPIDQRYDAADMQYLIKTVYSIQAAFDLE